MYKSKLYTFLGSLITLWFIYRIFILTRIPYTINEHVNYYMRIIVITLLCFQLYIFFKLLNGIITKKFKTNLWLNKIIELFFYKPLRNLGENLLTSRAFQKYIEDHGAALWYTIKKPYHVYLIIGCMLIGPKMLLGLALILDVLLLNKIIVFYEMVWITLMPLSFMAIIGCIQLHFTALCKELPLKKVSESHDMISFTSLTNPISKTELNNNIKLWSYYNEVLDYVNATKLIQKKPSILILNLLTTTLFIVSWSGYLYLVSCKPSIFIITDPSLLNIIQWLVRTIKFL